MEAFQALVHGMLYRLRFQEDIRLQIDDLVLQFLVDLGLLGLIGRFASLIDQGIDCRILQPSAKENASAPPSTPRRFRVRPQGDLKLAPFDAPLSARAPQSQ